MCKNEILRFIQADDVEVEELPWGLHHWIAKPEIVDAQNLLLVRVRMPSGKAHQFHTHPEFEEIIYVLSGRAEQWIEEESRELGPGDAAHIPMGVVHGTYNNSDEPLDFLAILSPAHIDGPAIVDVCQQKPWCDIKTPVLY
jgi:quercetin dioxygenase-like cupin family protein